MAAIIAGRPPLRVGKRNQAMEANIEPRKTLYGGNDAKAQTRKEQP
jgi:hypothetical protein